MTEVKQLILVSVFLVVYCNSAPWSDDNNFNENDLKWHCNQLCTSNNGEPKYDSETSICYCRINSIKDSNTDWKCLTNNARLLGLTLKIYESEKQNINKRETNTEAKALTDSVFTTENTDYNLTTTESTLLLPKVIKKIRKKVHKFARVHRPIILGATNPENETNSKIPENIKELRRRILERILELQMKNKRTTDQVIDNSSTTSSTVSSSSSSTTSDDISITPTEIASSTSIQT